MSRISEWLAQQAQADLDEHVRPEIQALVKRGSVTRAEVAELRCNSWEWHALVPALDDDAFVQHVEHAIKNSSVVKLPASTYDEAIVAVHVPELLRRFQRAVLGERAFAETIDGVRQALGQKATHHFVMADDVLIAVRALEAYASPFSEPSYRARVALAMIRGDAVHTACEACGKKLFVARPTREEDASPATFCIECGGGCVSMPAGEMVKQP